MRISDWSSDVCSSDLTIFAIGILHAIEQGRLAEAAPIATEVVHLVLSRRVLYMAVLLHDIAKGRGGDHSALGAKVAQKVCPQLGLDAAETERSEEHTSELQSLMRISYAVFCLKKKKTSNRR